MLKYIYQDMLSALRVLPWALVIGFPVSAFALFVAGRLRGERGEQASEGPALLFGIYCFVILALTLVSREGGGSKVIDLELFSTWGINKRNNALVIENVLLFIPYGFFAGLAFRKMRRFLNCAAFGLATSVGVECLQLVTGRGYFQLDDILTNMAGAVIGCLLYRIFFGKKN